MKTLSLEYYEYSYSTRLKFVLEENHNFILNYNDNDQTFSIHSSWGNYSYSFKEDKEISTDEFFQNKTKEDIFDKLVPKPSNQIMEQENYINLKNNVLNKLKAYFSAEKDKVQWASGEGLKEFEKIHKFVNSLFGIQSVFSSGSSPFKLLPDLHTGDSLIDKAVDEYIYTIMSETFKMTFPKNLFDKSAVEVFSYIKEEIKKLKSENPDKKFSYTASPKRLFNIKGIQRMDSPEDGFYRISHPFMMKSHYDYQEMFSRFHIDGGKLNEDESFQKSHNDDYNVVYGDFPNKIIFIDGKEIFCKNYDETCKVLSYIAQFWRPGEKNSDSYIRKLNLIKGES